VCSQFLIERLPAFLGEEDSPAFYFDAPSGAGDVLGKPMRPFHVEIDVTTAFLEPAVHLFLDVNAAPCASRSFFAQSSEHTSTVFLPILTLIRLASSSQSQAAQVLAAMTLPSYF
jgi:hypothetical protein